MSEPRIVSPRSLRQALRLSQDAEHIGEVNLLWGPSPGFGAYLLHHRELANLSLRAAASRLEVSHTHLAQMEQYPTKSPPSLELLVKIGIIYKLNDGELMHQAGYRWEMSSEVADKLAAGDERDLKALLLSDEFRPADFTEEDLDMFPRAVWRHVVNLARKVDASARKGGPTVPTVLSRARTAK